MVTDLGVEPPFYVFLSFVGVRGCRLAVVWTSGWTKGKFQPPMPVGRSPVPKRASKSTKSRSSSAHASKSMLGRVSEPCIAEVIEPARVHWKVEAVAHRPHRHLGVKRHVHDLVNEPAPQVLDQSVTSVGYRYLLDLGDRRIDRRIAEAHAVHGAAAPVDLLKGQERVEGNGRVAPDPGVELPGHTSW